MTGDEHYEIEIDATAFSQCIDIDSFYDYMRVNAVRIASSAEILFESVGIIQIFAKHNNVDIYDALDMIMGMYLTR